MSSQKWTCSEKNINYNLKKINRQPCKNDERLLEKNLNAAIMEMAAHLRLIVKKNK